MFAASVVVVAAAAIELIGGSTIEVDLSSSVMIWLTLVA